MSNTVIQNKDKNGVILKMQDWVLDPKGETAQLQNIRGVAIVKYKNSGKVLSKVDLSTYTKKQTGGYPNDDG